MTFRLRASSRPGAVGRSGGQVPSAFSIQHQHSPAFAFALGLGVGFDFCLGCGFWSLAVLLVWGLSVGLLVFGVCLKVGFEFGL